MGAFFVFSCLLSMALGQNAEINVKGFEGRDVSFRCSHRLASKNSKYFCKRSCENTEDILATVASGHRAESGRITLMDLGNGAFDVKISHLQLLDSSLYWCGVDRPGPDTYTSVYLTVLKASMPTLEPDVSSTWTQNNSALLENDVKTKPTNILTSTILLAAAVTGATLFILVLAAILLRKRRDMSKPQSHIGGCRDPNNKTVDHKETECVIDEVNLDKLFSGVAPVHKEQDPNPFVCTRADYDTPRRVYENIHFVKGSERATCPVAGQQNQDVSSRIYITLLPSTGTTADRLSGQQTATAAPQSLSSL